MCVTGDRNPGTQSRFGWVCLDVTTVISEKILVFLFFSLALTQVLSCPLIDVDPPSVFLVLEVKTFKQWRADLMRVKGDQWFNFLQDQTSCCLWCSFTTCMHNIFYVFCSFPMSDFIWPFLIIWFLSWYYFYIFFHVFDIFCHLFLFSFCPLWFLLPSPSCTID